MSEFESSAAMPAKRALFAAGLELAGIRLQLFAEQLLEAADRSPHASQAELVRTALREVDGGALALVADEPELHTRPLTERAKTVSDAAENVVRELGVALLAAHRKA